MKMTFEYMVVTTPVEPGDIALEIFLNTRGELGWELIHITPDTRVQHGKATVHAIFKRPVAEKVQRVRK